MAEHREPKPWEWRCPRCDGILKNWEFRCHCNLAIGLGEKEKKPSPPANLER
ncbi:hypothetical protein SAMN05421753_104219 [Planctomicrobium piriforme]|uniref:RanBP2-type domain-containing protein n=1 Tax=Planctomicrobium piriforme TaxID=1576369 RepID=A0A1I3EH98_9PLAN|nr:hypothetical protein SAMN05421753_104219 [Planctomicrobium piriforme]